MSAEKAWMTAFTKGSKALQANLTKVHAKNPDFQAFVAKHGFGTNLSVKQSGTQKKSANAMSPVAPEKSHLDRESLIAAAATKIRDRKMAGANRAAFGGELGGSFSMPGLSFRRYSEGLEVMKSINEKVKTLFELKKATLANYITKSAGKLRAATSLEKDYERDSYQYTNPLEKDAAASISKSFGKTAQKRLKGIRAAAGKLYWKNNNEEVSPLVKMALETYDKNKFDGDILQMNNKDLKRYFGGQKDLAKSVKKYNKKNPPKKVT